jgi:hypothetical protein
VRTSASPSPLASDPPREYAELPLPLPNSAAGAAVVITAAIGLFVFGTAWDVQWHAAVGRDRLLTAPHVLMLAGIAVTGLISLMALLFGRQGRRGMPFHAIIRDRAGLVLSGLGALCAVAAFPLDDYWHALYGIDVTLWAPFHVMIDAGMGMAAIGCVTQLASELRPGLTGRHRLVRDLGCAAALSMTLATFLVLIAESAGRRGLVQVGDTTLALYPILLSVALPVAVVCAAVVSARPGVTLLVAVLFEGTRLALFVLVPWATATLVVAEGLSFRPNAPSWTITPNAYPGLSLLLVALVAELGVWWARRRAVAVRLPVVIVVAAATVPASFVDRPWAALVPKFYAAADLTAVGLAAVPWVVGGALFGCLIGLALARAVMPRQRPAAIQRPMRRSRMANVALLLVASAAGLLMSAGPAGAHDMAPYSSTPARIGPYVLEVRYYSEPVGSRELPFEIVPIGGAPTPNVYAVLAVPGPSTNAVPVQARMQRATGHAGASGLVNLPVSGTWLLNIEVDGPLGPAGGDAPIVAALPAAAMPEWLAWLIGTVPVSATLSFVLVRALSVSTGRSRSQRGSALADSW